MYPTQISLYSPLPSFNHTIFGSTPEVNSRPSLEQSYVLHEIRSVNLVFEKDAYGHMEL
ncbi:hypothetical protein HMI54_012987 [Coelomomyces lativittatus]|nr:hypothetical protein HMI56_007031 [Coelomomyces lativittatus]KAJ1510381.1 hypothetical protein HMI55_007014 [Coelomomyces lativittatus]KAJ1515043.1 hypothetical protein HMI54_012987 [Coelomomyces lativittatus]